MYCAIAVAMANPSQLEHCHQASFAVNSLPVTMQWNTGSAGEDSDSIVLDSSELSATAVGVITTPRNS